MAVFEMTPEKQREWARKYREAAQPHVDGEIEAVGTFQRQGMWFLTIPILGQIGYAAILAFEGVQRAGGLPRDFMLAVTKGKVHALKYRPAGFDVKVQKEVGVFDRGDIRVSEHRSGTLADAVTLEVTEDGETEEIKINANMLSKNPFSAEVLELLRA
ncbi:MAG: hypothetical protein ACRDKH_07745 [Solirubrobacterales bacterium]